nr:hypothetical protein [Tanacetum cinerariifolium]
RESIRNVLNASKFNSIKYLVLLGLCRKLLPVGTHGQFIKERLRAFLLAPMRGLSAIGKTCWGTLLRLLVLEEEASLVDDAVGTVCVNDLFRLPLLKEDKKQFNAQQ